MGLLIPGNFRTLACAQSQDIPGQPGMPRVAENCSGNDSIGQLLDQARGFGLWELNY